MREGQEQEFLPPLRESKSVRTARTNGDQRLDHLIAGALRIGPGIDKSRQTLHAKRREDEHLTGIQERRYDCIAQMTRPHAGGKTDREADDREHQRRAEVRFFRDQSRHKAKHHETRQERSPEQHFAARSPFDKPSQE